MGFTPSVLDVTSTVTVQFPLAGIVIPLKLSEVAPFAKLFPLDPVHVPPAFCAPLMDILASVSVKLAPVIALVFGLVNVNVIVEVAPDAIELGENALAIVGDANTVTSSPVLLAGL